MRRAPRAVSVVLLLLALVGSCTAAAYRPFEQTDADVVALRWTEAELGPMALRHSGNELLAIAPSLVLNYGIAPRMELVAEGRNEFGVRSPAERTDKIQDLAVSLKILARAGSLQDEPGLACHWHWSPARYSPRFDGETALGAQVGVIASQRWPAAALHLNVSGALTRSRDEAFSLGGIVEGPLPGRFVQSPSLRCERPHATARSPTPCCTA